MPKIRSNSQAAAQARRKGEESRKRDDNLFPDEDNSSSGRRSKYGSRTKESEEKGYKRERVVEERDTTSRGREESKRDDRRNSKHDRNDSSDSRESRSRNSKELAEIRYQLNRLYSFVREFKKDMSDKEVEAWDGICIEANADEFCLESRSSRRSDKSSKDSRGRSYRGDDEDMNYRKKHKGQDRHESNGLCRGDIRDLLSVIKDERLKFKGRLDDDLFRVTEDLNMGEYSKSYERSFLNLLKELSEIKLNERANTNIIDNLVDIYMPADDDDENDRGRYDRDDYEPKRRPSLSRRGRDDYDDEPARRDRSKPSKRRRGGYNDREDDAPSRDRGYSGRSKSGNSGKGRYNGRNGYGKSQHDFDFDFLDDTLADLESLPGFIDDLTEYGYEAYSYMVTAIRNCDDTSIAEDISVFMEELRFAGMDYALTNDQFYFLSDMTRYQSQANRYVGRQQYGYEAPQPYMRQHYAPQNAYYQAGGYYQGGYYQEPVPVVSRRVAGSKKQRIAPVAPQYYEQVAPAPIPRRRQAGAYVDPQNKPIVKSRRSVNQPVNTGKYAGRNVVEDCGPECVNYEPINRGYAPMSRQQVGQQGSGKYVGRNAGVRR